jgi:hypothetical protein
VSPDAVSVVRFLGVWLVAFICLTAGLLVLAWLMLKVGSWRTTRLARRDAAKANAEREERERLRYSTSDGSTFWANRLRDAGGNPTPTRGAPFTVDRETLDALAALPQPPDDDYEFDPSEAGHDPTHRAIWMVNDPLPGQTFTGGYVSGTCTGWAPNLTVTRTGSGSVLTYTGPDLTQPDAEVYTDARPNDDPRFDLPLGDPRRILAAIESFECMACGRRGPCSCVETEEPAPAEPLSHPCGWTLCVSSGFICAVAPDGRVHRYSPSQLAWVGAGEELSAAAREALGRTG